jgi:Flp pilus assembly protein TadD
MGKSANHCRLSALSEGLRAAACVVATALLLPPLARAGDLKITLPRRSNFTPVQRLNRDGVEAVRKHNYLKAQAVFYKAYLLDPDDSFTLNNLGYVAELQGEVERAQHFYALAAQAPSDAQIAAASSDEVGAKITGRTGADVVTGEKALGVNHSNVEAVKLLSQGRASEADLLLQEALKSNAKNIFTLNNLGVAKEMEGESQDALKYYDSASALHSDATALVTVNRSWRGKPMDEMAAQNAKSLRKRLAHRQSMDVEVAELNLRGVSAVNRNDLKSADLDFRRAYALDPQNAFVLNNIGYLAEIGGDRETAEFFYDRAKAAAKPKVTVGLASRRSAEGLKLSTVASESDSLVEAKVSAERATRREKAEPILLRRRDNTVVAEPTIQDGGNPNPAPEPQH